MPSCLQAAARRGASSQHQPAAAAGTAQRRGRGRDGLRRGSEGGRKGGRRARGAVVTRCGLWAGS
eukprot:298920-Chlamydomonas_euryale.AAC.3